MTFLHWFNYFKSNQNNFSHINWQDEDVLTTEEKAIIKASIQQFQRGENSEGKHLLKYARHCGLPFYLETTEYFIREEQRHAMVLGTFMEKHGIEKIYDHWVDNVFRRIRNLAALENSVIVLITAEIIAAVYYRALANATSSELLKKLCEQILSDEDWHISFQSYTLHHFHSRKNVFMRFITRVIHTILMTGTIGIVWLYHYKVLRKGGYGLVRYYLETMAVFYNADAMITGTKPIPVPALEVI